MRYEKLEVAEKAKRISIMCFYLTRQFPDSEKFGLVSQITRAGTSVVSNIVEGNCRGGTDFKRFLRMALGSLEELNMQFEIAKECGFISDISEIREVSETVARMINGLTASLKAGEASRSKLKTPKGEARSAQ